MSKKYIYNSSRKSYPPKIGEYAYYDRNANYKKSVYQVSTHILNNTVLVKCTHSVPRRVCYKSNDIVCLGKIDRIISRNY